MHNNLQSRTGSRALLTLAFVLSGTTLLAGNITGAVRGRLSLAASPYFVTGDLRVQPGDSLVIEPGVEMRFGASSSFIVEGVLIAHGTEQDSIRFTSNAPQGGAPGDWNGIFLYRDGESPIQRAVVSYAATGITCDGSAPVIEFNDVRKNVNGIDCLNGATPQIRYNQLAYNVNAAIRCSASAPMIQANLIRHNALSGFESAVVCNGANPTIQLNLIYANGNSGIDCANGAAPLIYQNTLAGNNFGITISDSDPVLHNNLITGSITGISCENAAPQVRFNNVVGNLDRDFLNCPPGVGERTTVNFNNDSCDVFANISFDPFYVNPAEGDFRIGEDSPCVDAGNPANPADFVFSGARPDIGFHEFDGGTLSVEFSYFLWRNGELVWETASETNNLGFEIQRAIHSGSQFVVIAFVPGNSTTASPRTYHYRDEVNSGIYYYRLKQIDTDGSSRLSAVLRVDYAMPRQHTLGQNYPNPFNPSTTIAYEISGAVEMPVRLLIYNGLGQVIRELINTRQLPGRHQVAWAADDALGRPVTSGVYFYRLEINDEIQARQMILVR